MKRDGFTLVEIVISLVIIVAIGLVVGVGLDKVFDKNKTDDYKTMVNKVISSADAYLTGNTTLLNQLQSDRGYITIRVSDLIGEGLLDENLINPETGEKVGNSADDIVMANLDANGVLKLTYPAETITEAYLEAQNKIVEYNSSFVCNQISSYALEWGTPTLRLVNADGTVNRDYNIEDVIKTVNCSANIGIPGTYPISYGYSIPSIGTDRELSRSLIVSPAMNDFVTLTATVSPAKVILNNPVTVSVIATDRTGATRVLSSGEYTISSLATNVAGKFTPTITSTKQNSDSTVPTTTVTYDVIDNITEVLNNDPNCTAQSDSSCWYIGSQTGNYLTYSNLTWRIYKKYSDNSIGLILNNPTGSTYAFTNSTDSYSCSPSSCCNSGYSLTSTSSSYLLTQNPNNLNTYLTSTFLNTLTNNATYLKTTTFDITGYGSSSSANITQKVGLLSYADYSKIARCSTFSCGASYLNSGNEWGLGTYYQTNISYNTSYDLSTSGFNRYVYPRYSNYLYVNASGHVATAAGSFTLTVSNTGRVVTTSAGYKVGVKPVIVLNSGTKITGGTGTAANPYRIG